MTSKEEIKAQSEWAIKYNRCCDVVGGGDIVTCTEKIYALIEDHRKTLHALWMARALRAHTEKLFYFNLGMNTISEKWAWAERKCIDKYIEKAKEFE